MSNEPTRKLPIAVLVSGAGRSLANLIRHRDELDLPIDIRLVISSRRDAGGLQVAKQAQIPAIVIRKTAELDDVIFSRSLFDPIRASGVELVVMAGFLKHVMIPSDFENRVINIHPSLLPAFGGAGMYGQRVHEAAIERNVSVSGCTVHYVDNHYDNGPIILQRWCELQPDETPQTLAARVFELECEALPAALRTIAASH